MPRVKSVPVRSARPSRGAAQTSKAINNAIFGSKKNIGPALIGRPVPNKGIGVKKCRQNVIRALK